MNYPQYIDNNTVFGNAVKVNELAYETLNVTIPVSEILKWSWCTQNVRELMQERDASVIPRIVDALCKSMKSEFTLRFRPELVCDYVNNRSK